MDRERVVVEWRGAAASGGRTRGVDTRSVVGHDRPVPTETERTVDASQTGAPLTLAIIDDFEVVVAGVAKLMEPFGDRVHVVELTANKRVSDPVDVALVDTFAQGEAHTDDLRHVLDNPLARRAVIYTWQFDDEMIRVALDRGFDGYLSKRLSADGLVDALEEVVAGEVVVANDDERARAAEPPRQWPGRGNGLSEREAEVLAFITAGLSNAEIAELLFLSQNSIKTYIRSLYRKIDVDRRTRAVLWGIDHGFRVDHRRLDDWREASRDDAGPAEAG